jgi:hypothetical protein
MVANSFARSRISPRAKAVALYVMSHTDGFELTQHTISSVINMAVRTVSAALSDLEAAGLLLRVDVRNSRGHRTGTAMLVSDVPFTDQERADLLEGLPAKSAGADCASADSAAHKKTTSKKKTNTKEEPSGGATADAEPAPPEPDPPLEDAVPPRQTETLFDVPAPPKPPKNPSAADVVAAYIDSFRQAHDGKDPLRRDFLRVGRDARDLLKDGAATVAELTTAATRMGLGEYANLGQELKFTRRDATPGGRGRTPGMAKAASCDDPGWDEIADAFQATTLDPDAQAAWNARFASV